MTILKSVVIGKIRISSTSVYGKVFGMCRFISRHLQAITAAALLRISSSFLEVKGGPPKRREGKKGQCFVGFISSWSLRLSMTENVGLLLTYLAVYFKACHQRVTGVTPSCEPDTSDRRDGDRACLAQVCSLQERICCEKKHWAQRCSRNKTERQNSPQRVESWRQTWKTKHRRNPEEEVSLNCITLEKCLLKRSLYCCSLFRGLW